MLIASTMAAPTKIPAARAWIERYSEQDGKLPNLMLMANRYQIENGALKGSDP